MNTIDRTMVSAPYFPGRSGSMRLYVHYKEEARTDEEKAAVSLFSEYVQFVKQFSEPNHPQYDMVLCMVDSTAGFETMTGLRTPLLQDGGGGWDHYHRGIEEIRKYLFTCEVKVSLSAAAA